MMRVRKGWQPHSRTGMQREKVTIDGMQCAAVCGLIWDLSVKCALLKFVGTRGRV